MGDSWRAWSVEAIHVKMKWHYTSEIIDWKLLNRKDRYLGHIKGLIDCFTYYKLDLGNVM